MTQPAPSRTFLLIRRLAAGLSAAFLFALPLVSEGRERLILFVLLVSAGVGIQLLWSLLAKPRGYPLTWYLCVWGGTLGATVAGALFGGVRGLLYGMAYGFGVGAVFGGAAALLLFAVRGPLLVDPADLER